MHTLKRTNRELKMHLNQLAQPAEKPAQMELPLLINRIDANPHLANEGIYKQIDLNQFLVKTPSTTFLAWAEGESLQGIGIDDGDLLVIDRTASHAQNSVVVATVNGELTCKILDLHGMKLLNAKPDLDPIYMNEKSEIIIEGVVIHSIKQLK